MSLSIKDLKRRQATDPPRTLIYGSPGMGKTTLAAEWPNPVFIQTEDGTPAGIEISSFGLVSSYDEVMDALIALYDEEHDRQTVVIDSLDKLEPLVWRKTCEINNWKSIESPGYGKGYVEADKEWRDIIDACNALRRDRQMAVVFIAHSHVVTAPDPIRVEYQRFDIRLHKRALGMFQDEVDAIFFLNHDVSILPDDPKKPDGRVRGAGGGNIWIHASRHPAYVAKNRYDIPEKMMFKRGEGFAAIAPYLPGAEAVQSSAQAA